MTASSATAVRVDLKFTQGDGGFAIVIPLQTETGADADLSGFSARFMTRGQVTRVVHTHTATIVGNRVQLQFSSADSAEMDEMSDYDFQVENGSLRITPQYGVLFLRREITT